MNYCNLSALVFVAVTSVACSSTQFIISTKQGHMVTAYGKPQLDEKSGMYTYKDSDGKKVTIKKDDVVEVMER